MSNRPAILVTGGARRLGEAMTRRFGAEGWHVVIHHHNSHDEAEAVAADLPSAETIAADLSDPIACDDLVTELAARLPDWRAIVSSAAVFDPDDGTRIELAAFDKAMATNARAPVLLAQAYFRHAESADGRRFVQITDQKVANPNPDFFSYSMSKFAVAGAVAMLAKAARTPDDRIYALAPGAILASHDQSEEETEVSHRLNLLRRKTGADEIAEAALFLASGALASGQTLFVDSGQWLLDQPRDVIYLARESVSAR